MNLDMYLEKLKERLNLKPDNRDEQPAYQCSRCRDSGWIEYKDESGCRYMTRCPCTEVQRARQMMKRSGISEELQDRSFDNFITGDDQRLCNAKNKASEYQKNFEKSERCRHNSFLLCGQSGAGKTHLGIAICNELMKRQIAVTYMAYRNSITRLKQNITDREAYDMELDRYLQARVLYIDDFLKGKITDADVNIVYEMVNYRYMNNLPIIVSTEKSIRGLLEFDEAAGSRLIEMCRGNIVQLKGKELNYRLK